MNSLAIFNSTLNTSIKISIFVVVFLKEGLVHVALQKAVVIDPFVDLFKEVLYKWSWSLLLLKKCALKQHLKQHCF